ncbi:hypothetical protein ACO1M1_14075, partial [Staphylococcus aureus]
EETTRSTLAPDEPKAGEDTRRVARRRPAGPVRPRMAANDDAPTIGGLIFALEQKPSNKPFTYAAIFSALWAFVGLGSAAFWVTAALSKGTTLFEL